MRGYKESYQEIIEISDWSYETVLKMLEYLYTGQVLEFNQETTWELLGLADAYNLKGLVELCENTLLHDISSENVCSMLV